ncbi:MAG: FAD/NAD(P)-binding protein [Bacteroidota bacterium]|nr:FAD/NAD(P)-binding protein [Bacteroidota bacterium]
MSKKIIIIGGGLSGTLVAMNFLENSPDTQITLIEKNPEKLGRGVAYHHDFTHQPLNVVASAMSLFSDRPSHFVEWLTTNHFRFNHLLPVIHPDVFVPRKIFGDYIIENLELLHHKHKGRLQIRIDEVISLTENKKRYLAKLESGVEIYGDDIILALGNFPPADLFTENDPMNNDSRYFSIPWVDRIYSNIKGDENILLVGTGLTAVDVVLGLKMRGFNGKVTMVSRRGRLPSPHNLSAKPVRMEYDGHSHPRDTWFWVKGKMKENHKLPWTSVIDGLRPLTQKIWMSWTLEEKKYFMKRLRPFWEIARHRIPSASNEILNELIKSGRLEIGKGEIRSTNITKEGIETEFMFDNLYRKSSFQKIINCTGPESNYRKVKFPIIRNLMEQGKVVSDELGLGINCTPGGKILDQSQKEVEGLWCIGPMRKSILWETTALRELREQATELVGFVLKKQDAV